MRQSFSQRQSQRKPFVSRFTGNESLVLAVGDSGLLPPRFEGGLATPYASVIVETDNGTRYVVRVKGLVQVARLRGVKAGNRVKYNGKFHGPRVVGESLRGSYFAATEIAISNTEVDARISQLTEQTAELLAAQGIEQV